MRPSRLAIAVIILMTSSFALSACHVVGHAPPGQVKQILNPPPGHGGTPPGHGGTPPGQRKK